LIQQIAASLKRERAHARRERQDQHVEEQAEEMMDMREMLGRLSSFTH
jgi:hypothetical protein